MGTPWWLVIGTHITLKKYARQIVNPQRRSEPSLHPQLISENENKLVTTKGISWIATRTRRTRQHTYTYTTNWNVHEERDWDLLTIDCKMFQCQNITLKPSSLNRTCRHGLSTALCTATNGSRDQWLYVWSWHTPKGWVAPPEFKTRMPSMIGQLKVLVKLDDFPKKYLKPPPSILFPYL